MPEAEKPIVAQKGPIAKDPVAKEPVKAPVAEPHSVAGGVLRSDTPPEPSLSTPETRARQAAERAAAPRITPKAPPEDDADKPRGA